MEDYIFES